jgi:hypothetical protein
MTAIRASPALNRYFSFPVLHYFIYPLNLCIEAIIEISLRKTPATIRASDVHSALSSARMDAIVLRFGTPRMLIIDRFFMAEIVLASPLLVINVPSLASRKLVT